VANQILPIVSYFELTGAFVGSGELSADVILARAVSTLEFDELELVVRVHSTQLGTNQSVDIEVFDSFPSDADGDEFEDDTARLTLTVDDTVAAGKLLRVDARSKGPYVRVVARVNQNPAGPGPMSVRISVDLIGRCCGCGGGR